MTAQRPIAVVAYDPAWSEIFPRLRKVLENHLGDLILVIGHVGLGVAAKPII